MKKIFIIICLIFLSIGCGKKKYFKEVISTKKVTISMRELYNEKYLTLNIPVEFQLNLNQPEIKVVGLYWDVNGKLLIDVYEYAVMDSQNNKMIYAFQDIEALCYPNSIYLLDLTNKISPQQAVELIKKYNPGKRLEDIKSRKDTIELVSYSQYRKDNSGFLDEMRKVPDSLTFSVGFRGGERKLFKERINW